MSATKKGRKEREEERNKDKRVTEGTSNEWSLKWMNERINKWKHIRKVENILHLPYKMWLNVNKREKEWNAYEQ